MSCLFVHLIKMCRLCNVLIYWKLIFFSIEKKSHTGKYLTIRQTRATLQHKTVFGICTNYIIKVGGLIIEILIFCVANSTTQVT